MRKFGTLLSLGLALLATAACGAAPTPTAEELAAAAVSDQGAFEAFDESCLGVGDLSSSLSKVKEQGWIEFTPPADSMLDRHREMLLDGPAIDRPEVVFLRKNSNRAQIVMSETTTLSGSDYIFHCEVVEEKVPSLDLAALDKWAGVPIKVRQIDDSPEYHDLFGGRFANGGGGKATAYFTPGEGPRETLAGLVVNNFRSSFAEERSE